MATKKYLVLGRLWGPIYPSNEVPAFEEEFLGGGRHTGVAPAAEARLWQAEDGDLAIFIANYIDKEVKFSYSINPQKYGLDTANYQISEISPDGDNQIAKGGKKISRTELLGPGQVKVIEFSPLN